MTVMIGVGPHKGSHTAVAIGAGEEPLGRLRVRASVAQAEKLVAWAADWPGRTWAVEGAGGLGHLLDWQLVAAGERVLDVPPEPAARVRLLQAGDTSKNDPDDALSVAIARAALQGPAPGDGRGLCRGTEGVVQAAPGSIPGPQPGRLPAPRRVVRTRAWRLRQGNHRRPGRPRPRYGHPGRRHRPGPP